MRTKRLENLIKMAFTNDFTLYKDFIYFSYSTKIFYCYYKYPKTVFTEKYELKSEKNKIFIGYINYNKELKSGLLVRQNNDYYFTHDVINIGGHGTLMGYSIMTIFDNNESIDFKYKYNRQVMTMKQSDIDKILKKYNMQKIDKNVL
jgi:hypothetical protein